MDDPTKLYVLKRLIDLYCSGIYSEGLDVPGITEYKFSASSSDLVYNMMEVQRSLQAKRTARLAFPSTKNDSGTMVLRPPFILSRIIAALNDVLHISHQPEVSSLTRPPYRCSHGHMTLYSTKFPWRKLSMNFHTWLKRFLYG